MVVSARVAEKTNCSHPLGTDQLGPIDYAYRHTQIYRG